MELLWTHGVLEALSDFFCEAVAVNWYFTQRRDDEEKGCCSTFGKTLKYCIRHIGTIVYGHILAYIPETLNTKIGSYERQAQELRGQLKTSGENETKDGMDIALCVINKAQQQLHFAGAFNPLFQVHQQELTVTPANRQPIGIYAKEKDFEQHSINWQPGDMFYLFTDGYADQFGGPKGKKMGTTAFKELLLSIHALPVIEQQQRLTRHLEEWQQDRLQLDDILVIGFRV